MYVYRSTIIKYIKWLILFTVLLVSLLVMLSVGSLTATGDIVNARNENAQGSSLDSVRVVPVASSSRGVDSSSTIISLLQDTPELIAVARCESGLRQFNSDGSVLRGVVNSLDIGLFQLNLKYHGEQAKKLGYDIFTIEGNVGYAKKLYKESGLKSWYLSQFCWQ